jgi:hypothetical protein
MTAVSGCQKKILVFFMALSGRIGLECPSRKHQPQWKRHAPSEGPSRPQGQEGNPIDTGLITGL